MSRGRRLTHEERVLWGRVVRSAKPLRGRGSPDDELENDAATAVGMDNDPPTERERPAVASAQVKANSIARSPAALNPIERPVTRKIARGRLPLEARIDLHGLMQAEAHDLLRAFLLRAHERGLRHVLVITGKGSSRGSEGVLKRAVPQWLGTPDFRFLVSGYETAARGHGGDGALYIRLKRQRGGEP